MDKIINGDRRCPECRLRLEERGMELVCRRHGVVDDFYV